jgi:hypothetical protein
VARRRRCPSSLAAPLLRADATTRKLSRHLHAELYQPTDLVPAMPRYHYEDNFGSSNEKRAHKFCRAIRFAVPAAEQGFPVRNRQSRALAKTGNARLAELPFSRLFALSSAPFGLLRSRSQTVRSGRWGLASFAPVPASQTRAVCSERRRGLATIATPFVGGCRSTLATAAHVSAVRPTPTPGHLLAGRCTKTYIVATLVSGKLGRGAFVEKPYPGDSDRKSLRGVRLC